MAEKFQNPSIWLLCRPVMLSVAALCASPGFAQDRTKEIASPPTAACTPRSAITGSMKSVSDGRTFVLTDGREVRLPTIEIAETAQAALSSLVAGRELTLSPLAPATNVVEDLSEIDLERLTRRLWTRIRRELRGELLIDRERAGALADVR